MAWLNSLVLLLATTLLVAVAHVETTAAEAIHPAAIDQATELQIRALIKQMSLEEKVGMLGGTGFATRALPRLGIPAIEMTDGPVGVRNGKQTAFPSGISMAATFNPKLVHRVAAAIADETRVIGRHMLLGPCIGVSRHPFGGRNFEGMGEDPYLTSRIAEEYVRGIQSRNILASVKHFAVNDQETERDFIDTHVDLRSLFEIHLPAFKAAVDAGSWTVMASYNKINGFWATENDFLQNRILKGMWNFKGFIVSDWGATHHTIEPALYGLDLEMPYGDFFGQKLVAAVQAGQVPEQLIDDKVSRILRSMYGIGLLPSSVKPVSPALGPESAEHRRIALKAAHESIVLLKNDSAVLPFSSRTKSIAVIGPNANFARTGGGGSSQVEAYAPSTPLQGLRARVEAKGIRVQYAAGALLKGDLSHVPTENLRPSLGSKEMGLRAEFFENRDFSGAPFLTRLDPGLNFYNETEVDPRLRHGLFAARWSGYIFAPETGLYDFSTISDDGIRVVIAGKEVISNWKPHMPTPDEAQVELAGNQWHEIRIEYFQAGGFGLASLGWELPHKDRLTEAVELAQRSDVAVVFAGLGNGIEGEGYDRDTMDLPTGQDELINAIAAANPNTVVVLNSGNPMKMGKWIANVKAVVQAWYPGQEGGYAIADILLGRVNPSGKLPVTFLKRWEDSPAFGHFPGKNATVTYNEGIFVGYRHFDTRAIEPEFPFGHGLSYTQFSFQNLRVKSLDRNASSAKIRVEFDMTNLGRRRGAEVAQLYVGELHPKLARPVRELKGFRKVHLKPGQRETVSFDLDAAAFSYFDVPSMSWKVDRGAFRIEVGSSSRAIALSEVVQLQ